MRKLVCADWFGDYRSLRFLCAHFGGRIFYFGDEIMELALSTTSVLTDGTTITKKELLEFFVQYLQAMDSYNDATARIKSSDTKIAALEMDSKRRTFPIAHKEPPRGLAALSLKEKRAYQRWLDTAAEREAEQKEKERAEELRLKEVGQQLLALRQQREQDALMAETAKKDLDMISGTGILPHAYLQPQIVIMLAKFFVTNRAHTLTEAINLYHQELHWQQMNDMQKQQMYENAAAHRALAAQNQMYARQIITEQREAAAELRDSLDDIKRSVNEVKFYAEMDYLYNLF